MKRVLALDYDMIQHAAKDTIYTAIPQGHCWVEGDNRAHSADSNSFGPVRLINLRSLAIHDVLILPELPLPAKIPQGLIIGVARMVVWPPRSWRRLESKEENPERLARRSAAMD